MFILYFLALIPIAIGIGIFYVNKEVCWQEWLIGSAIALLTAGIGHFIIFKNLTGDTETWSGVITHGLHEGAWTENYEVPIYKTVTHTNSDGTTYTTEEFSHYETRTEYHPDTYTLYSNAPSSHTIKKTKWEEMAKKLGKITKKHGDRTTGKQGSRMTDGDPYDYQLTNITGWIEPVHVGRSFENRIKNSHSILKSYKVSKEQEKNLFPYPYPTDAFQENRLLGVQPPHITPLQWSRLNSELGPLKRVNLILIGFTNNDPYLGEDQYASWIGGKKNDIILLYGPGWSKVFGWSESELCKQNLQTLLLNPESPTLLQDIRKEILINYQLVDWDKKYAYISVQPTGYQILIYLGVLLLTQTGLYIFFSNNEKIQRFRI